MATGLRKLGDFCWINILTPRPAEAMEFFGKILRWTFFEMPGIGHGMKVDGRNIGGLFDIDGPNTPKGLAPVIGVMVKVADADATCEKVTTLGGKAKPAFDIGEQGRMAVCFDPNGGAFDVWEPKQMLGTDADSFSHGAPAWYEAFTTDMERASTFYSELFGWTPRVQSMPGLDDTVFQNGGTDMAGMMAIPPEMASVGVTPHWATYFTVDDVDEAAKTAVELGAKLFVPLMDIPGIGRFCGIISPQGVRFYAIRYLPRANS